MSEVQTGSQAVCRLGFSCASMMQHPGLSASDCENRDTCGLANGLPPDDQFELQQVRLVGAQRVVERIRTSRRAAAQAMLQQRGNPQTLADFALPELLSSARATLDGIETLLQEHYSSQYIAPRGSELHRYNVKRPARRQRGQQDDLDQSVRRVYWYNKLTADQAQFLSAHGQGRRVRTLHLSHDDDPRHEVAQQGIERRNRLVGLQGQLARLVAELEATAEQL